ncbi:hypothetical protein pb186bvf_009850 [Paramecium bursaria]
MYYAALDQSTTSTKIALYNEQGGCVLHQAINHQQITLQQGWLEHDPQEIIKNVKELVFGQLQDFKVESIGITNQRETTVAWNKLTGQNYGNAIVWSDTRTIDICQKHIQKLGKQYFQKKTGLPINTYFSAYKIQWMIENNEDIKNNLENIYFGTIDSWIIWNLTGQFLTDVTNASRTNLLNLQTLDWDDEILDIFNIKRSNLAKIQPSQSNFGQIKGIKIGAVMGDQQAASIGHSMYNVGDSKCTYGSGLFMLVNIGNEFKISNQGLLTTILYQKENQPPVYAFEGAIEAGGQTLNWAKDKQNWFENWQELSNSINNNNGGVYFIPSFSGYFTPYWKEDSKGLLYGLTFHTTKQHIQRAILESLCYRTKQVINCMIDSQININQLKVDGGLTQNQELMQLQADILRLNIQLSPITDSTCSGVAQLAGNVIFIQDIQKIYKPQQNYDEEYQKWLKIAQYVLF